MHRAILCTVFLAVASPMALAQTASPVAAGGDARCAVWKRELSFGDALAAHDHAAFAEHLHRDAVFGVNDPAPTRGANAIAAEWKTLVDGTTVNLAWYPRHVVASADGTLAWSTGPSLVTRPDGSAARIGSFQSVWQRDAAGAWHVLFDGGIAGQPATPEQVAAFHAGRQRGCAPIDATASRP